MSTQVDRIRRYNVSEEAAQGAMRGAHISIRASRWRLINAMGEEYVVPTLHLDVIVIRANRKSKLYFAGAWDPNNSGPPTCFSDNGIGPSSNALQPQSERCLPCPWNQMNSKINPETGKGSKACSDRTKLAVIIPGDQAVNVYELQVPPKSLTPLNEYILFLKQQADKPDISDLVTRLEFNDAASHPQIKFSPQRWVKEDPADVQMINYIYDQRLDEDVVGLNDVPADPEVVRQAQQLRLHGTPERQAALAAPQFQLPQRGVGKEPALAAPFQLPQQTDVPYTQAAQQGPDPYAQTPAATKPRGRPPKNQPAQQAEPPAQQVGHITQAKPVTAQMPDVPDFLRRNGAPASLPPVQGAPSPQPPGLSPQFGMAGAPPPPAPVSAALEAAMRMPPRR